VSNKCSAEVVKCDVCTDDFCDSTKGCQTKNNTAACDDNNQCTVADACKDGKCAAGSAKDCDDKNSCTLDVCDSAKGCLNVLIPNCTANICVRFSASGVSATMGGCVGTFDTSTKKVTCDATGTGAFSATKAMSSGTVTWCQDVPAGKVLQVYTHSFSSCIETNTALGCVTNTCWRWQDTCQPPGASRHLGIQWTGTELPLSMTTDQPSRPRSDNTQGGGNVILVKESDSYADREPNIVRNVQPSACTCLVSCSIVIRQRPI
jgi:hypothetical protein